MSAKKILIVDDEVGIVEELRDFLSEEGYEVSVADTAKHGISLVDEAKPDVALIDMKLPDLSGIDVLRYIKENSPGTKTIMMTGYVDQVLINEAENLGRDIFIQKPFDLEEIMQHIGKLV